MSHGWRAVAATCFAALTIATAGCGGGGGGGGGGHRGGGGEPPPSVASATRSSAQASPAGGVPANGLATATITVVVRDRTGTPVAGAVVALASSGSGNTIFQPAQPTGALGVATGRIASTVAERKTITVTVDAGGPRTVTLATTPVVEFSAVVRLAFVGAPGASAAGSAIPGVSVAIVDASGAPFPTATNAVTITLGNARGATLGGTTTQGAIGGVAVFPDLDVEVAAAGYTLVAAASGFADVTSAPFDVSGGPAAELVFRTQPSDAQDLIFVTPPVEVLALDRFDNVATFGGQVQVALGPGAGNASLFGTRTKAAVGGLATFSNLDVDVPGSYTLVASAGGLTSATSTAFAIRAGPPVALKAAFLTPLPDYPGLEAGTSLPPLEVHVVDAAGADAIGSVGPISVTIVNNPVGGTLLGTTDLTPGPSNVVTFTAVSIDREARGSPYVLGVSASGLPLVQVGSLEVLAAPFTHVTFTAQPAAKVLAGFSAPGAVAIQATDDFGNVDVDGFQNGTVTLTLGANPGGATLLGSTSAHQSGGRATFPSEPRVSAAGQGYALVATLESGVSGTSAPFDVVAPVRVTSFASDHERAQVKDEATLSWTIEGGPPDTVTLDPGGKSESTAASGSDSVTPFPATPTSADPRATFRLSAKPDPAMQTDIETLAAAKRSASNEGGFSQTVAIAALPDGSALVTGFFAGTMIFGPDDSALALTSGGSGNDVSVFIARYNPDLTVAWARATGSDGAFASVSSLAAFPDGGAVVTGFFFGFQDPPEVVFGPGEPGQVTLTAEVASTADRFIARYAPDGSIVWAKRAQGNGSLGPVAAVSDGSAIVVGMVFQPSFTLGPDDPSPVTLEVTPPSVSTNTFIARYAPDGTVAWAGGQAFSPSGFVSPDLVAASPDGGAVVAGRFSPDLTVGPFAFASDANINFYLARYGPDGTLAWATRIAGAAGDDPYSLVTGLTALPDGGVMLGGTRFSDFPLTFGPDDPTPVVLPPEASLFLARYAADGTVEWAKRGASGGSLDPFFSQSAMAALPDGSAIFTGFFSGTIEFDPDGAAPLSLAVGPQDFVEFFVAGFGPDGAVAWADRTDGGQIFPAAAIAASEGGAVFFAGSYASDSPPTLGANGPAPVALPSGFGDVSFLAAYAPFNFALVTVRPEGLAFADAADGTGADAGNAVAAGADGGALVAGSFEDLLTFGAAGVSLTAIGTGDAFLARYGPDGSVAWAKQAGGAGASTIARGLAGTLDGGAVAVGSYAGADVTFGPDEANETPLAVLGGQDIFVARHAADGSLLWAKRAGGSGDDEALAVAALRSGSAVVAVVTGFFNGHAVFGPGTDDVPLDALGPAESAFVAGYGYDGSLYWAARAGGTGSTRGQGVAAFPDGSSAVTGFFDGDATFGPDGSEPVTLTSAGGADVFIARYDRLGTLLWVRQAVGAGEDRGLGAAAVAEDGSVLVTGFFSGSATFGADGPTPLPVTLTSQGAEDVFVARYDKDGNLIFAVSLGGGESDEGTGIAALPGGGAVVAGLTTSAGIVDALVAWVGPDGSLLHSTQANGTSDDRALGVAALPDGSAFLTGSFAGTSVIFGLGETNETTLDPPAGASAVFTAKYFFYGP